MYNELQGDLSTYDSLLNSSIYQVVPSMEFLDVIDQIKILFQHLLGSAQIVMYPV